MRRSVSGVQSAAARGQKMLSATAGRTRQNLTLAGVSASLFGRVLGVPPSSMRAAFSGEMKLSGPTEAEHFEISCRLLKLVEALKPLRCDDPDTLRKLLEKDLEHIRVLVGQITE